MTRFRFRELVLEEVEPFRRKVTFTFSLARTGPWTLWVVHAYTKREASAHVQPHDTDDVARDKLRAALYYAAGGIVTALEEP